MKKKNTKKKYISREQRKNVLLDKVEVNHYFFRRNILSHLMSEDFIKINETLKDGAISFRIPGGRNFFSLRIINDCYKCNFVSCHNLNELARDYIAKRFKIKKISWGEVSRGKNFIPLSLRHELKERNVSIGSLKKRLLKNFYEEIVESEFVVSNICLERFGFDLPFGLFETSLRHCEVSLDVVSRPGEILPKNKKVKQSFCENVKEFSSFDYKNQYGDKLISPSSLKSIQYKDGAHGPSLEGYCYDGARIKLYVKEESKLGTLNRFEKTYKKNTIIKTLGTNKFSGFKDFQAKFNKLSKPATKLFYNCANIPTDESIKNNRKIIRKLCKLYFKAHEHDAYKLLAFGAKVINTSQRNGNASRPIVNKARELVKKGVFLRSPERTIIKVDKRYINNLSNK